MPRFKVDDKVKWKKETDNKEFGWEERHGIHGNLDPDKVYIVGAINKGTKAGDYSTDYEQDILLDNGSWYHPDHFMLAKVSNEDRIKERRAKLASVR